MHAKMMLNIFRERMHLKRKIATINRVQKVETDRKLIAKPGMYRITKQGARLVKHKIQRRDFKTLITEAQHQAVFLRNAVETPAEIFHVAIQVAYFLHPLTAPRRRVKKWNHPKWTRDGVAQSATDRIALRQFRFARVVCIEHKNPISQ